MALHVQSHEKYQYTLPIIKLSEDEKIPVLPLYLIASLKNDKYTQNMLTDKNDENHSNFSRYFSMSGIYQTYGSLNFSGEIEIVEVEKTPKEYAIDVLSKYVCDNYDVMQKILKITSFSKYLFISILFLLNEHKFSLKDIDDFFNMQSDEILDITLDKLFTYKDLDYQDYVKPIDIQPATVKVKITDLNICNLVMSYSSDDDFIHPIKLKTILEYSGIPSRKTIDGIINELPALPSTFFTDELIDSYNGATLDFYEYIDQFLDTITRMTNASLKKYKYELDSALFRSKFPLIRQIVNTNTDIFLNNGNIVPTIDSYFYQKNKYPNPYDKNIEYCDFLYYLETPSENFKNIPKIKIINLADYDFLVETSETHAGSGTKIKMSDFVTEYQMEDVSTLAAIVRYKDLELIYLLDTRDLAKMVKTTWDDVTNESLLAKVNKYLENSFSQPFTNAFYELDSDREDENSATLDIINTKEDETEDGKLFNFLSQGVRYYILAPNDSYLDVLNKKAVVFPDIKLDIKLNNNKIRDDACSLIGNRVDNLYVSNTNTDKTTFGKITSFNINVAFDDVLYQVEHFKTKFNIGFNITTKNDEYSKAILRHTYVDVKELGKTNISLGDGSLESVEITDYVEYNTMYDDYIEETEETYSSIPTSSYNTIVMHVPEPPVYDYYEDDIDDFFIDSYNSYNIYSIYDIMPVSLEADLMNDNAMYMSFYNSYNYYSDYSSVIYDDEYSSEDEDDDMPETYNSVKQYKTITSSTKELEFSFPEVQAKTSLKETALYYYNKKFYLTLENHNPEKTTVEPGGQKV